MSEKLAFLIIFCFISLLENSLIDAELISIGYELTQILPILKQKNLSFRLNHTSLLNAIFINYNVPREKYMDVFVAITDYSERRISKFQLSTTMTALLESSKHNATSLLDILLTETALGGSRSQNYLHSSALGNLIKGHSEASKMARKALEEIDNIVTLTQSLGVMVSLNAFTIKRTEVRKMFNSEILNSIVSDKFICGSFGWL